jgi:predicted PurR-regulated permease PerM
MHPVDRLRETRLLPVFVILGVVALALFVAEVASVLPPFLWAAITAYLLYPLVVKIENALRLPRIVVVAGLYIVFVLVVAITVIRLGPVMMDQVRELTDSLPDAVRDARAELIEDPQIRIMGVEFDTRELDAEIDNFVEETTGRFRERALPLVFRTVELAIQILVYLLATFYFLLHGDSILRQSRVLAPRRYRPVLDRVGRQVNATFGAYVRGQLILFAIMSVATFIALTILGVDYAIALAVATGLLELVPLIGPWIAGSMAVVVALSQGHAPFGWTQVQLGAVVALTYFVLRMLEDHLIIPQLIGRIVRVHPVLVVFAVLTGAHLFGMLGLLLAVPLTAAAKIVAQAFYFELSNPPARRVFPIRSSADLSAVREEMEGHAREHIVLLLGPGVVDWDDLRTMQELAMLAVGRDVTLNVVTADPFAASLATASGIPVVTQARLSDEVGMAESVIEEQQERMRRRRRFGFRQGQDEPVDLDVDGLPIVESETVGS